MSRLLTPEQHRVLIEKVDAFLFRTNMAETRLSRDALNNPSAIRRWRDGTVPQVRSAEKLAAFMLGFDMDGIDRAMSAAADDA